MPSAVQTLSLSQDSPNSLFVNSEHRAGDSSQGLVQSFAPKSIDTEKTPEVNKLVEELYGILKDIPTEEPKGSEDIYGMDTSIMWGSDDLEWMNGGPAGCVRGSSTVQASEEDKKKFKRAVEIVKELVEKEQS
jgi:hypothetical protein